MYLPTSLYAFLQSDQITREQPISLADLRREMSTETYAIFCNIVKRNIRFHSPNCVVIFESDIKRHLEFFSKENGKFVKLQYENKEGLSELIHHLNTENLTKYYCYMTKKSERLDASFNKIRTPLSIIILAAFSSYSKPLSAAGIANLYPKIGFSSPTNLKNLKDYIFTYISMWHELSLEMNNLYIPPLNHLCCRVIYGYRFNRIYYTSEEIDRVCQALEEDRPISSPKLKQLANEFRRMPEVQEVLECQEGIDLFTVLTNNKTPYFYAEELLSISEASALIHALSCFEQLGASTYKHLAEKLIANTSFYQIDEVLEDVNNNSQQDHIITLLSTLRLAISNRSFIRIYLDQYNYKKERVPDRVITAVPLNLICRWGSFDIICLQPDSQDIMFVSLGLIQKIELVEKDEQLSRRRLRQADKLRYINFINRDDEDLKRFLIQHADKMGEAKIEFVDERFTYKLISYFGNYVKIEPSKQRPDTFVATVMETKKFISGFCLSYCDKCVPIYPPDLVETVKRRLKKALTYHESGSISGTSEKIEGINTKPS